MDSKTSGTEDRKSARRRLIRGAFAAPAALTLFSGSVAAGSLSCVAAVVNSAPVDAETSGASLNYLRVPLRVLRKKKEPEVILAKFVSGEDLAMLLPPSTNAVKPYLAADHWECVYSKNSDSKNSDSKNSDSKNSDSKNSDSKNSDSKNSDSKNSDSKNSDSKNWDKFEEGHHYTSEEIEDKAGDRLPEMQGSSEYIAVRVSADGDILGVQGFYDGSVKTSAMAVSCWTSFGGEAPFNGF